MNFDHKGLITPAEKLEIDMEIFYTSFITAMPNSTTRENLFKVYREYIDEFEANVTSLFSQWIGGSFTTKKTNPKDIDLVTLMPQEILTSKEAELKELLISGNYKAKGIDAYFLGVRPLEAVDYPIYRSDALYWIHQFSRTRKDRKGKKHPRGFIEIKFNNYSYE